MDKKDVTDPFCDVKLGKARLVKTSVVLNDLSPQWNEDYRIEVCHHANYLIFEIRDKDHARSEFIGSVDIPVSNLLNGSVIDGWFPIKKKSGKEKGELKIRVEFKSREVLDKTYNVDCYFPMHDNCRVTLYQDAHCPEEMPLWKTMQTPTGVPHKPRKFSPTFIDQKRLKGVKNIFCIFKEI